MSNLTQSALPITTPQSLLRLLMLSSTALPVGAYCYSQGVESAIDREWIRNESTALAYFEDVLELMLVRFELPMLAHMMHACRDKNNAKFQQLATQYCASRESSELLAETRQLGFSLTAWVREVAKIPVTVDERLGFLPVYAALCVSLGLQAEECLTAYAFTQLENLVLAAVKTVPLGQISGQRILWAVYAQVPAGVARALQSDAIISSSLPGLAMLSIGHESQYSRLFRS
ncbi:urease accessory protein UreF [Aquirhabdus parva]|uniref:Urease accessory protein UreF n=1 Tax=Aquirhabdus parva TaxID=2283318 RepID=A0A345P847_9GAMM|nr:urease accessory UreF family protein [Aquirhabdus parva]AXI03456.1 urease accessory protein [Aquirhabdus parva]